MKNQMSRGLVIGQSVLLGLTVIVVLYLGNQVHQLEARVDALQVAQSASAEAAVASVDAVRRDVASAGASRSRERGAGAVRSTDTPDDDEPDLTTIDDHLWSEGGRQAIGDVVEEREEADRDRRTERWQQMMQYRTEQAVGTVSADLELSEREAEQVTTMVDAYMEARSRRWRQMNDGEEGVDFAEIEAEYEASREQIDQDLIDVIGEDGLEQLREELRKGWR